MRSVQVFTLALSLISVAAAAPTSSHTFRAALVARNETEVPAEEGAGEEAEAEEGEVEAEGQFDTPVALEGGDVKQDVLFPAGTNGVLEVEFQNAEGRTLTVTENTSPAAAPDGFVAVEAVTYKIDLAEGADNLTLSKVDYILNADSTLDISQGKIGRFCTEANAFVIDSAVGELEFEAEENELTLSVANMNGEWGIFIPDTANAGEEAGAGEEAVEEGAEEAVEEGAEEAVEEGAEEAVEEGTEDAEAGQNDSVNNLLDAINAILAGNKA